MSDEKNDKDRRGIQSVEVGGQLLRALAHHGHPMALKDLARAAGMAPAKAHPYLVSFGKLGLIEQDPASGRYGLGPLALQLGLIALQQTDPVRIATPMIAELAQRLGLTIGIAVWGTRGPTFVRLEESPAAIHVNMRHGTVASLTDTASGRLFGAYRPADEVRAAKWHGEPPAQEPTNFVPVPDEPNAHILFTAQNLGAATKFMWPIADRGLRRRLPLIDAPTLVVHGTSDGLLPLPYAEEFVRLIPNATLAPIDAAGHYPMVEQEDEFIAVVTKFLES